MKISKTASIAAFLTLLLLFSSFSLLLNFGLSETVTSSVPTDNGGSSGFSDMLQYEWPQLSGDSSFDRFSSGPAPEAPDILWKTDLVGIQSYVSAFNGMVFVNANSTLYALNKDTGAIIWNTTVPVPGRWPTVYKIDDSHMLAGTSCLDTATGRILWTSTNFSPNANTYGAGVYSPEEKMFYVKINSYVQGWNFSDPSKPPTMIWSTYDSGGNTVGSGVQYGDGKVFPGSFEAHQMALDAKTGAVIWDVETASSMIFAGSYSDGKFFRGGPYDNSLNCFDANTGKVLWTFEAASHDGYFCTGSAVAYGMVYELNKDGSLYALDVNTGDVIWTYQGPGPLFFPGNPIIADGKVYVTTGQRAAYDPYSGNRSQSEFACLDAYTGQPIWKIPVEAYCPRESTAIAYGNLYLIPGFEQQAEMDKYDVLNQVWAIGTTSWPMWRHDPQHSGTGQSGPENLTLSWRFSTEGAVVSSPSIANGLAYFGSQDKNIYSVDASSGNLVWKFTTLNRIYSTPAVVNGKVYTGTDDGNIYCLNAYNGSLIWKVPAGNIFSINLNANIMLRSSPTVSNNIVYVGALDNKTYAFNATSGALVWTYQTKGYITTSPAVSNGVVYVISQEPGSNGGLYLLKAATGELIKRLPVPYQQTTRGTDLMSSPVVVGDMVYTASNKKAYYGVNVTSGTIQWTYINDIADEFINCSPVYNDGKLYIVDDFIIVCLDAYSGDVIWHSPFLGAELYVSPTYGDGKLYLTTDQRSLYVLNATDGTKLSYFALGSNSWSSPTLYQGRLYVGDNDWDVYCFATYPLLNSNLTLSLGKEEVASDELVTGWGQLTPGMPNSTIAVTLTKPDGTSTVVDASTSAKGSYTFTFQPNTAGNWSVRAEWRSDKSYYTSTTSEKIGLSVQSSPSPTPTETGNETETPSNSPFPSNSSSPTAPPFEEQTFFGLPMMYVYLAVIVVLIVVIVAVASVYRRTPKK